MARIRYLKPDFFKDEDLADLPFEVRLFYAGLWCHADKAGRLEDRPKRLKAEIFPYDNVDAEKCLDFLVRQKPSSGRPFINRYEANGERYIQIVTWLEHQRPHHTEKDSEIPPAPPMEKGMEKGMEKEKQLEASAELGNRAVTVNPLLSKATSGDTHSMPGDNTGSPGLSPRPYRQKKAARFEIPSEVEVAEYAQSIGFSLDGQSFIDFYTSKGWKVGNTPMKDWKACVRTWKKRHSTSADAEKEETAAEMARRLEAKGLLYDP